MPEATSRADTRDAQLPWTKMMRPLEGAPASVGVDHDPRDQRDRDDRGVLVERAGAVGGLGLRLRQAEHATLRGAAQLLLLEGLWFSLVEGALDAERLAEELHHRRAEPP